MRFFGTRLAAAFAATLAIGIGLAPAAVMAGGNGATIVRGVQQQAGTCDDGNPMAYLMHGSLEGCWIIDEFYVKKARGTMLAYGTEHFSGWLNGALQGTFYTTFTYTAQFDGATELHGRCHHPLVPELGTGDFAGARGEINFTDVVEVPEYPYWGSILLARGTGTRVSLASATTRTTLASATLASAVSAPC